VTTAGAPLKALWFAAEAFGDAVGLLRKQSGSAEQPVGSEQSTVLDARERSALLRADYDENYFISGRGSLAAYDADCVFADPFVSFTGRERFRKNVSNLGGLLRDVKLDITSYEENEEQLVTAWRFAATVELPWRPRLFAKGGTTHVFDSRSGLVVRHDERWDIEPWTVVKQLFTPGKR